MARVLLDQLLVGRLAALLHGVLLLRLLCAFSVINLRVCELSPSVYAFSHNSSAVTASNTSTSTPITNVGEYKKYESKQ